MPAKNVLTIKPGRLGTSVEIAIGNAGGTHAMILTLSDLMDLEDWIGDWRRSGGGEPLSIPQGKNT